MRPPKGLSQKWSLGEVVVLVKGWSSRYYNNLSLRIDSTGAVVAFPFPSQLTNQGQQNVVLYIK